jgi:type I restriction enzyme S subunit
MIQELLTGRIRLVTPAAQTVPTVSNSEGSSLAKKAHNWEFNEAVVIAVLTKQFGSEPYPLARKRCTKLTYLLHRHMEGKAEGYLKKAAGPYNPATKYKGPEKIAQLNKYVRSHHNGTYPGFVASTNVAQAESYFYKWYGVDAVKWLEQFHYSKTDELELIATVDMAMQDLRQEGKPVELAAVKQIIQNHPEWEAKLDRDIFSDDNITKAIQTCGELFPVSSSISEG